MSQLYELVIFTASQKQYADQIIDQIDPKQRISYRLYRDHCIIVNKVYYLKNLKILGRDLKNTVLIDVTTLLIFRTIKWLEFYNLKIFIEYSNF
jgi:CTD small phosphatase-like protein 2